MKKSAYTPSGGFRKMFSFGFTCLVYHATTQFCKKVYTWKEDPLGKTYGQMIGAARSARQNIVEASTRAGTSKETEMKLLDVARGSLAELQGDYEAFLIDLNEPIWSVKDARHKAVEALRLEPFEITTDVLYAFSRYLLEMRTRFASWLENEDPRIAANAMIVIIEKTKSLLYGQMQKTMHVFSHEDDFKTRLKQTKKDLSSSSQLEVPNCPQCGKPMRRRIAKNGENKGHEFWGCSDFPNCKCVLD